MTKRAEKASGNGLEWQFRGEGERAKRLANPGGGKIITKTAKNSSFTP